MIDETLFDAEEKMEKAVSVARDDLASIRTGRANPSMFNGIVVDYYGAPTPLQQLASLTIPEARTVLVSPFDRSAMKDIVTAIRESDLGVNPTDDGTVIRVTLPALTEERRKDYVKLARSRAEEIRRARTATRRDITRLISAESDRVGHLSARLTTLGPAATLARGYAVVQAVPNAGEPHVVQSTADAPSGTRLRVRVADGAVMATSEGEQ